MAPGFSAKSLIVRSSQDVFKNTGVEWSRCIPFWMWSVATRRVEIIGFTALTSTAVSEGSRKKTFFHQKKQQKLVPIPNWKTAKPNSLFNPKSSVSENKNKVFEEYFFLFYFFALFQSAKQQRRRQQPRVEREAERRVEQLNSRAESDSLSLSLSLHPLSFSHTYTHILCLSFISLRSLTLSLFRSLSLKCTYIYSLVVCLSVTHILFLRPPSLTFVLSLWNTHTNTHTLTHTHTHTRTHSSFLSSSALLHSLSHIVFCLSVSHFRSLSLKHFPPPTHTLLSPSALSHSLFLTYIHLFAVCLFLSLRLPFPISHFHSFSLSLSLSFSPLSSLTPLSHTLSIMYTSIHLFSVYL